MRMDDYFLARGAASSLVDSRDVALWSGNIGVIVSNRGYYRVSKQEVDFYNMDTFVIGLLASNRKYIMYFPSVPVEDLPDPELPKIPGYRYQDYILEWHKVEMPTSEFEHLFYFARGFFSMLEFNGTLLTCYLARPKVVGWKRDPYDKIRPVYLATEKRQQKIVEMINPESSTELWGEFGFRRFDFVKFSHNNTWYTVYCDCGKITIEKAEQSA